MFWLPCRGLQGSTYRQIFLFLGFPAGGGYIWWLPGNGALLNFGDWGKPVGCVATAGENPNPETPFSFNLLSLIPGFICGGWFHRVRGFRAPESFWLSYSISSCPDTLQGSTRGGWGSSSHRRFDTKDPRGRAP